MGVDPDYPSLEAARAKPDAGRVEWIYGNSRAIPANARFDVVLMTSNVVQEILDDVELARSLADIAAHLVPGGRLAFDARDPNARGTANLWDTALVLLHSPDTVSERWA